MDVIDNNSTVMDSLVAHTSNELDEEAICMLPPALNRLSKHFTENKVKRL